MIWNVEGRHFDMEIRMLMLHIGRYTPPVFNDDEEPF